MNTNKKTWPTTQRTLIEECEQAHKDYQQKQTRLVTPPNASSLLFVEIFID